MALVPSAEVLLWILRLFKLYFLRDFLEHDFVEAVSLKFYCAGNIYPVFFVYAITADNTKNSFSLYFFVKSLVASA